MRFKKILPEYSWFPCILLLGFNILTYMGTRLFTQSMEHHMINTCLDDGLPFVPEFILVYLLAFVQWTVGYMIIARESREVCYRIFSAELFAKICCLVCFITYPTTIVRPEITGDGIWDVLCSFVYSVDAPDNLFPSIHCLESWVVFRGAMYTKRMPGWYKWVMLVFSLLVFASTVLVRQHVLLDMAGAVIFVEIGLFLSAKFNFSCLFELTEKIFCR